MLKFINFVRGVFSFIAGLNPITIVIGIAVIVALCFAVPNYEKVLSFFGYDTRAVLKDKLEQANQNTQTAVDANKTQDNTIKVLEDTVKHTDEAIGNKIKHDEKVTKVIKKIQDNTDVKIDKIEADTTLTPLEKQRAVNLELVDSLWVSYCSFNAENPSCDEVQVPQIQTE